MTNEEFQKALVSIQALFDRGRVQCKTRYDSAWEDVKEFDEVPILHFGMDYRVKPREREVFIRGWDVPAGAADDPAKAYGCPIVNGEKLIRFKEVIE